MELCHENVSVGRLGDCGEYQNVDEGFVAGFRGVGPFTLKLRLRKDSRIEGAIPSNVTLKNEESDSADPVDEL